MAEQAAPSTEGSAQEQQPQFSIQRVYLKDVSFESSERIHYSKIDKVRGK